MSNTLVIARRKGGRVRMFDTTTAKLGPWEAEPQVRYPVMGRRDYEAMTRVELRALARSRWNEDFTTRARKSDMIDAILSLQDRA